MDEITHNTSDAPHATRKPLVSYQDFAKLTIRLGTITGVEVVPEADKLLKLSVDFGDETRQIISGIRAYFPDPQALVGMQAPFIVNLEPRVIRGLESQGMILAASHEDQFGLLTPHQPLPPGSAVL
jgi:methionyl-tRNA synthetase